MASDKQIAANRANAQLSSGPTSAEGKLKISHNAVKTGLTGRTVLLPSDDVEAYQALIDRTFKQFSPVTDAEKTLTQSLADTAWRLDRIPSLEAGICAIGRRTLAGEFADEADPVIRRSMIEAQIFLTYRRDLSNLSLQAARLRRQYEKDEAALKALIAERAAAEKARWDIAVQNYQDAQRTRQPFDPKEIGFEFATDEFAARAQAHAKENAIRGGYYYTWSRANPFKPKAA